MLIYGYWYGGAANHVMMSNEMGDDDVRAWFPCPFCYVDIEIPALSVHLQEEHCFDLKNAVRTCIVYDNNEIH